MQLTLHCNTGNPVKRYLFTFFYLKLFLALIIVEEVKAIYLDEIGNYNIWLRNCGLKGHGGVGAFFSSENGRKELSSSYCYYYVFPYVESTTINLSHISSFLVLHSNICLVFQNCTCNYLVVPTGIALQEKISYFLWVITFIK